MIHFGGVYAALLTPRDSTGAVDVASFRTQLAAPAADRLAGYAVGGATGEFTFMTTDELSQLVSIAHEAAPQAQIFAGIGASDLRGAVARGQAAADAGADAVLLPMPCFFPYRQDDLYAFCHAVASELPLPILLYNLPQFTTGLQVDTVLALLQDHSNIVGVKDSSGSLDLMRAITASGISAARVIGNDGALRAAMQQGLCDGVISGVACSLPELMTSLFAAQPLSEEFAQYASLLDTFIAQLDPLPTPWGLKVISAARGLTRESYPFPLSPQRREEIAALRAWFETWQSQATGVSKA